MSLRQCQKCHATGGDGNALPVETSPEWQAAARELVAAQSRLDADGTGPKWAVHHARSARRKLATISPSSGPERHLDCGGIIVEFSLAAR